VNPQARDVVVDYSKFCDSILNFSDAYCHDITPEIYFGYPIQPVLDAENRLLADQTNSIAYFSMEFGIAPSIYNTFSLSRPLDEKNYFFTHEVFSNYWLCDYLFKIYIDKMLDMPIYGGGLGVLAGDTVKSAADCGYSLCALGILWNKGYFKQNFWYKRGQVPEELKWDPQSYPGLIPLKNTVQLDTNEGPLHLRIWKYYIYSHDKKFACPIILLDSNLDNNPEHFQRLTDQLYRSDDVWWKICQRSILGIGGMKALANQNYHFSRYHLNEGHAALALLEKYVRLEDKAQMDKERQKFIFTCHTPVAAGHDRFNIQDAQKVLTPEYIDAARQVGSDPKNPETINLTYMSLTNCQRVNAVAQKHGDIMRLQFPPFAQKIGAITNGIHIPTWIAEPFEDLFNHYSDILGDWKRSPQNLERVLTLKSDDKFRKDLVEAHLKNKRRLLELAKRWRLRENAFTLGWARRIAGYKRPALIFHNIERIIDMAYRIGSIQIILAGKAHPNDDIGGAYIDEILDHIDHLNPHREVIKVLILENYDTFFGKLLTNSVDVWLNNPLPPFEASGTSGMKAIVNGVLQISTLDGWVVEAVDDDIGWIFGYRHEGTQIGKETDVRMDEDSQALCDTLEKAVQLFYETYKEGAIDLSSPWIDKMIHCVARSAFFNTDRMINQYREQMWQVQP